MIKDTKQVKEVRSNSPKKGWKIEWSDGKFDNFFDEAWIPILDEAQKTQHPVYIEKEKNQAGYWNIIVLKLADETAKEDTMTKEDWANKDHQKQSSIESQKAYDKGMDVYAAYIAADKTPENPRTKELIKRAIEWGISKLPEVN